MPSVSAQVTAGEALRRIHSVRRKEPLDSQAAWHVGAPHAQQSTEQHRMLLGRPDESIVTASPGPANGRPSVLYDRRPRRASTCWSRKSRVST